MSKGFFIRALVLAIAFLVIQLIVGCGWEAGLGFSGALFFGWCACEAARPWRSLLGLLTISLYVKTVLFGCVLKTLLLQRVDEGVRVPAETAAVFALGFAGVFLAVLLVRVLPLPPRPLVWIPRTPRSSFVLWGAILVLGGASWFLLFQANIDNPFRSEVDVKATWGRIYHLPGYFSMLFPFAPAAAVFYLSQRGRQKLITHPLVLISVLVAAVPGFLQASKQGIMFPFAAAWIAVLVVRGPKYKPLWWMTAASVLIFIVLVYPLVQLSRGSVKGERLEFRLDDIRSVTGELFGGTDYSAIYGEAQSSEVVEPYLPRPVAALDRFVRYVEASRLVEATTRQGQYTGFFTIEWGFRQILPRFLFPDKSPVSPDHWLSEYTGDVGPDDQVTNFAYGFMAGFFNAFGYWGAFVGSALFYAGMTYWLRLFVEGRAGPTIWIVAVFLMFESQLVESCAATSLSSVWIPLPLLCYSVTVQLITSWIWPRSAGVGGRLPVQPPRSV